MSRSIRITKTGAVFIGVVSVSLLYLCFKYGSGFWPSSDQTVDMHHLLAVSAQLAKLGGDRTFAIRKEYAADVDATVKGKTKEGADELLTRGDMESHRIMRYGLEKTFPGVKVNCAYTIRYDTRFYFNVRSKADMSQLNLSH